MAKKPSKSAKTGVVFMRLPKDVDMKLRARAERERRPISQLAALIVEDALRAN